MKITPLEIRQKTFEKVFRGYEKDEVNAYLHSLSMEWERLLDENKELNQRIESLEAELKKLRELESSLFKTLKTAEDTGATLIEQAKKETDLKLKESSLRAERILSEASNKAKNLVETAEIKRKQIMEDMIGKIRALEGLFGQMTDLREKVADQVKNYSKDLLDRIEKLEKKSEDLHVKDIMAEARKTYNSSMVGTGSGMTAEEEGSHAGEKKEDSTGKTAKKIPSVENKSSNFSMENPDEGNTGRKQPFSGKDESGRENTSKDKSGGKNESPIEEEDPGPNTKKKSQVEIGFDESAKNNDSGSTSFFDEIE